MNTTTLIIIGVSITIFYLTLSITVVFPAWKKYKIQKAKAAFAKCFRTLNEGPLPSGKICDGHYLHDSFYRLLLKSLVSDEMIVKSVSNAQHGDEEEQRRLAFRREVDNLNTETRAVVNNAIVSIGWVVFFQNMLMFPLLVFKNTQERIKYKQRINNEMMRSGEYMAVSQSQLLDDCHA